MLDRDLEPEYQDRMVDGLGRRVHVGDVVACQVEGEIDFYRVGVSRDHRRNPVLDYLDGPMATDESPEYGDDFLSGREWFVKSGPTGHDADPGDVVLTTVEPVDDPEGGFALVVGVLQDAGDGDCDVVQVRAVVDDGFYEVPVEVGATYECWGDMVVLDGEVAAWLEAREDR